MREKYGFEEIKCSSLISEEISLQNNIMTDESMPNLIKIFGLSPVKTIDLTNNNFSCGGAKDLARFIIQSGVRCKLQKIVLSLNNLGQSGSDELFLALETNKSILHLDLSSNRLDHNCCKAVSKMLAKNSTLKLLSLACNKLGSDGSADILEGLKANENILKVDVRLTECGREVDLAVQVK